MLQWIEGQLFNSWKCFLGFQRTGVLSLFLFFFFPLGFTLKACFISKTKSVFYERANIALLLPMCIFAMQGKKSCLSCLFVLGCVAYVHILNNGFAGHALSCSQPRVGMRVGGCCRNGISMGSTYPECKQCRRSLISSHK